jgi:hypothetical protein
MDIHPIHHLHSCTLNKMVSSMASKSLIVFALLLAAAFLIATAEETRELVQQVLYGFVIDYTVD